MHRAHSDSASAMFPGWWRAGLVEECSPACKDLREGTLLLPAVNNLQCVRKANQATAEI